MTGMINRPKQLGDSAPKSATTYSLARLYLTWNAVAVAVAVVVGYWLHERGHVPPRGDAGKY